MTIVDYAALRAEGIRHLEEMTGTSWTDFNAHDPGITILDAVAYVLSDLLYRNEFSVSDLLASSGAEESLFGPEVILPCRPVTDVDLRAVVLDVPGVRNAWVEPSRGAVAELHYHPGRRELSLTPDPPASEPVALVGLYSVFVEADDLSESNAVRARVAQRLHAGRPLCTDFVEIGVLHRQLVRVDASIEIGTGDPDVVLFDVVERIADHLSPPVEFVDAATARSGGLPVDELFDGPLLHGGHLSDEALHGTGRRTALRTSDLVHAIMEVPGVRAVTRISVAVGSDGAPNRWSVDLDPTRTPRLDLTASTIELTRDGLRAAGAGGTISADHPREPAGPGRSSAGLGAPSLEGGSVSGGRDRSVGRYRSLQHELPALYGIAEMGLPRSADPARRAQAKQLKAYLLLFDQLLANMFAQLAHVGDLFEFRSEPRTYFAGTVDDERLGLDDVRERDALTDVRVAAMVDHASDDASLRVSPGRRDRFLTHLLARFAEEFGDATLVGRASSGADGSNSITRDKQAFLQQYPLVSAARGTGHDDLAPPGREHPSGLAERIRLKLGLVAEDGEDFVLVEHILLRPVAGDEQQAIPLLTESDHRDPYSLRVSFVFATTDTMDDAFRRLVLHTIRAETPAHLVVHVHWLDPDQWQEFRRAHTAWRDRRRRTLAAQFGVSLEDRS